MDPSTTTIPCVVTLKCLCWTVAYGTWQILWLYYKGPSSTGNVPIIELHLVHRFVLWGGCCCLTNCVYVSRISRLWGDCGEHTLHHSDIHLQVRRGSMHPTPGCHEATAPCRTVCSPPARVEDLCYPEDGLWQPQQGTEHPSTWLCHTYFRCLSMWIEMNVRLETCCCTNLCLKEKSLFAHLLGSKVKS